MSLILSIETTTKNCSVALFKDDYLIGFKEEKSSEHIHSEKLTLFIQEVIINAKKNFKNLNAIAVSKGPGSFTGLRIGTSSAKGLCYALDIPLISVSTLRAMALSISKSKDYKYFCPMIDARRMEVYASLFDQSNNVVREIRADIVDENTYSEFLDDKVLFFGDGAEKCLDIINNTNAHFHKGILPSAIDMGKLAIDKFSKNEFEDVAYYEPFYLKDFFTTKKATS